MTDKEATQASEVLVQEELSEAALNYELKGIYKKDYTEANHRLYAMKSMPSYIYTEFKVEKDQMDDLNFYFEQFKAHNG